MSSRSITALAASTHVLAVVDDQQERLLAEVCGEVCLERPLGRDREAHAVDQRRHDVGLVRGGREVGEVDPGGECGQLPARGLDRHAGLPDTAGSGEGHQPMLTGETADARDELTPSDQARTLRGQGRHARRHGAHRGKVVRQAGAQHLVEAELVVDVAEPVRAQVEQLDASELLGHRLGDEDLATVRDRSQARRLTERESVPALAAP